MKLSRNFIALLFSFGFLVLSISAQQQCSCSSQPQILGNFSFPVNTTVYYKLDDSLKNIPTASTGSTPTQQVTAALNSWSSADLKLGGSGIVFAPADSQHAATLTITADSQQGSVGATTSQADPSSGILGPNNPATITLHPDATVKNTNTSALDPTQAGYDKAYLQIMLHEIGHLEGIGDYLPESTAPAPGPCTSVMKPLNGVNDSGDAFPKTGPTDCDIATAAQDAATASGSGPPGGGGGAPPKDTGTPYPQLDPPGDGGSGGGNCDWNEYWDDSTNTLYEYCS